MAITNKSAPLKRHIPLLPTLLLLLLSTNVMADCVVLFHGLARSSWSMGALEKALVNEQFHVVNVNYPSREASVERLASNVITPVLAQCPANSTINFVTHSMGGILIRQYLSSHEITRLKYVVMLGPPNKGTELVDKLGRFPGFHFINGDAALQLGTDKSSLPNRLGKATFNAGIIAGNKSINWVWSALIPGPDDGTVSVENTKLEAMNDHIEMPVTHTFMMRNKAVIAQVIHYLKNGRFNRVKPPA